MIIREVILRNFKRFEEERFPLHGHVVLAGQNNAGKTTLLQAIAAWNLALNRWREINDFNKHRGGYAKAPIARQAFSAVPLRSFDLMWRNRRYHGNLSIEVVTDSWRISMEFIADSTEQIYLRPTADSDKDAVKHADLNAVFLPAMTGLGDREPVYQPQKIKELLGFMKPGEVLRNFLLLAKERDSWNSLKDSVHRLFGVQLESPDATGANIIAEFSNQEGIKLDIASAGSGFQQVLMLLSFLHTHENSVLLVDEPDAHLHIFLQDAIYGELRSLAARNKCQLIVATHSEVIIDSVEPKELCVLAGSPRRLSDVTERERLKESLFVLTQTDIMNALEAPGILYVEGHTDLSLLREWAKILQHPAERFLEVTGFWKPLNWEHRRGGDGIKSKEHYDALKLVREDLPALALRDSDAEPQVPDSEITGQGYQRLRWKRYEIESYLVVPVALERFAEQKLRAEEIAKAKADLRLFFVSQLLEEATQNLYESPHAPAELVENFLRTKKARTEIISAALQAMGIHGFDYTRFSEIAAIMTPEEIHPEVKEKLDLLVRAFRLEEARQ